MISRISQGFCDKINGFSRNVRHPVRMHHLLRMHRLLCPKNILTYGMVEIMIAPFKIWSVFNNTIYNAVRHTKSGGIIITAGGIETSDISSVATVIITDTGCGIESEHLPYIFDRFYKVSNDKSTHEGESGLGLHLVKSIMEGCGGSVNIESEPGKGTSVILTFKARRNN